MKDAPKVTVTSGAFRDMVDEQRIVGNWRQIEKKRGKGSSRLIRRRLALGMAVVLICTGTVFAFHSLKHAPPTPAPLSFELVGSTRMIAVPSKATTERRIPLSDGSTITLAPGASLEVKNNEPHLFRTSQHKGWVRYNVIPDPSRTWEVDVELCRVLVLGTQFTINRTPRSVHIAVHRGTVAVYPPTGNRTLATITAGKTYTLHAKPSIGSPNVSEPATPEPEILERARDVAQENPARRDSASPTPSPRSTRKRSNRNTPFHTYSAMLAGLGASSEVNDLLKKADDARQNHRPHKAAALLEQIQRRYPGDPAIGVVALTLGNIRLDTLSQPRSAATAFKQAAKSTDLPSPLREQAYARCVEAFYRSGDMASAQAMRDQYRRRFPNGAWLSWIERWVESE